MMREPKGKYIKITIMKGVSATQIYKCPDPDIAGDAVGQ